MIKSVRAIESESGPVRNGTTFDAVGHPDAPGDSQNAGAETKDAENRRPEAEIVDSDDAPDEAGKTAKKCRVVDEGLLDAVFLDPEHDLAGEGGAADTDGHSGRDDENRADEQASGESEEAQNGRDHIDLQLSLRLGYRFRAEKGFGSWKLIGS